MIRIDYLKKNWKSAALSAVVVGVPIVIILSVFDVDLEWLTLISVSVAWFGLAGLAVFWTLMYRDHRIGIDFKDVLENVIHKSPVASAVYYSSWVLGLCFLFGTVASLS